MDSRTITYVGRDLWKCVKANGKTMRYSRINHVINDLIQNSDRRTKYGGVKIGTAIEIRIVRRLK